MKLTPEQKAFYEFGAAKAFLFNKIEEAKNATNANIIIFFNFTYNIFFFLLLFLISNTAIHTSPLTHKII